MLFCFHLSLIGANMHQINWIKDFVYGESVEPFSMWVYDEWIFSTVDNNEDALGVLIMGGEL